jgi:hypothetical protein
VASAKEIVLRPIRGSDASRLVTRWHYSGNVVRNSQVHIGAFLGDRCGGVLQFGPPMMRRQVLGLVRGTGWSEMMELNRLAFADWMPRNGESRCLAVSMRMLRKQYPSLKWVLSFADGVQCGDGTIYRAAGFVLTGIRRSNQILQLDDGTRTTRFKLSKDVRTMPNGRASTNIGTPLHGHMFRYVYFLQPGARAQLTVPEVPYSKIAEMGLRMYRGQRVGGVASTDGDQPSGGGESLTPALHHPAL